MNTEVEVKKPRTCTVTIDSPRGQLSYKLRWGLGLQALAAQKSLPIEFDCREADCGICIFRVVSGEAALSPMTAEEREFLRAMRADSNERLACQCRILGDVHIEAEAP